MSVDRSAWQGKKVRLYYGSADQTVPAVSHSLALAARIGGAAEVSTVDLGERDHPDTYGVGGDLAAFFAS